MRRYLAVGLLVASAATADAQVHLRGHVVDDASAAPIAGATVTLLDPSGRRLARQLTSEAGDFLFVVAEAAAVRLQAERIGYRTAATPPLQLGDYTSFDLVIRLDVAAVVIAPLEVVARARADVGPTLAGFETRRQSGHGWYMTRDEITKQRASTMSNLLALAPGVSIGRARRGGQRVVYMRDSSCPAEIFVDGFHVNRVPGSLGARRGSAAAAAVQIDEVVHPSLVEGIEVYPGVGRLPPEFRTADARCGVVAIWTRRTS